MILKTSKDFNIITTWGDNGFLEIIESQKDGFYGSIILDSQTNMIVKLTGYSSERFFKYSNLGSIDATFGTSGIKTFNYDDSQFSLTINPEEDRYEFYGELIYPTNHIPRGIIPFI